MIVTFGYLNKKSLLFLILPIIMVIRRLTTHLVIQKAKNMFYPCFIKFLSCSINGILWLIVKIPTITNKQKIEINKEKLFVVLDQNGIPENNQGILNKDDPKNENDIYTNIYNLYESNYYEKTQTEKKNNRKKVYLLIIFCVLDFLSVTYHTIVIKTKYYHDLSSGQFSLISISRLFTTAILSNIIIKNVKMYIHHYLSIIIILIILIAIIIFSLFTETDKNDNYFSKLGLMFLQE